ncbi:ABC transporter permease [Paenibacillus sp. GCM10012307]|uniref:ABC transporter permease n=1 Tax=Paenibacillus roseus TaxID=2798579 RepID=A0A934MSD9_9BACL|nr:ABC transporter permease [Paenibacillus roseus]MBJ6363833.1 ABC transporter permease [Paenibacillus roseus]
MGESLKGLWQQRRAAFRKEVLPYLQDMIRSGFPGFLLLLIILGMIGYGTLLRDFPADFPYVVVGTIVLTPLVCYSPLRTWLHPADVAFLMPREHEMGTCLGASWRHNLLPGFIGLGIMFALFLPLYERAASNPHHWALLVAFAAIVKGLNAAASWRERQIAWPGARRTVRLLRWILTFFLLAVLLSVALWKTALFGLLLVFLMLFVLRLPIRHSFPWERLIAEEERTRRRYYRFFGSFADIPTLPAKVARRPYLSWIAGRLQYAHNHTYKYLFILTLLRTELGGMLVRLTLLGMLVIYLTVRSTLLEGWGAAAVAILFLAIIRVQASALRQSHRHSVWRNIYPLPDYQHNQSMTQVVATTTLVCGLMLWLPLLLLLAQGLIWPPLIIIGLSLIYILFRLPRQFLKKLAKEQDD